MMMMRKCSSNNGKKQVDYLKQLPSDVVSDILVRLPAESLCCIQCVSKDLLNMVVNNNNNYRSFVTRHTASLIANNAVGQVPHLMYFTRSYMDRGPYFAAFQSIEFDGRVVSGGGNFAVSVANSNDYNRSVYSICFVFCNLFGVMCTTSGFFLINPLKGEVLRLPPGNPRFPHAKLQGELFGMGFDSITNTYKIVCVTYISHHEYKAVSQIHVLGTSSWRAISSAPPFILAAHKNVCAFGDMHWLSADETECYMISFDFKKEDFFFFPIDPILQTSKNSGENLFVNLHLLILRGCLAMLDTSSSTGSTMTMDLWILKDYDKKEWTRYYYINMELPADLHPKFGSPTFFCGQWKHGIYFRNSQDEYTTFFLDIGCLSVRAVTFGSGDMTKILSYAGSLISLEDFSNAAETDTAGSLRSYGKLIQGTEDGFNLSEDHFMRRVSFI